MNRRFRPTLLASAILLIISFPVIGLVANVLQSAGSLASPFSTRTMHLLWTSFSLSTVVGVLATLLGFAIAWRISGLSPRWRLLALLVSITPILVPHYIMAVAWIEFAGSNGWLGRLLVSLGVESFWNLYSFWGCVLLLTLTLTPLALLTGFAAVRSLPAGCIEGERLAGGGAIQFVSRLAGFWKKYLAAAFILVFLLAQSNYTIPSLLLLNVYSLEVYTQVSAFYDLTQAFGMALIPVAVVFGLIVYLVHGLGAQPFFRSARERQPLPRSKLCTGLWSGYLALAVAVPLGTILVGAGTWDAYADVFQSSYTQMRNSMISGAGGTFVVLAAGTYLFVWSRYRSQKGELISYSLALFPIVLPGTLVGLGLIYLFNRPGLPGTIYGSLAIILLALLARFAFFAVVGARAALSSIPESRLEEGRAAGLSPGFQVWRLGIPSARWEMALLAALLFAFCISEVETVSMVAPPGLDTLSMRIHSLLHYGTDRIVMASCVIEWGLAILPPLAIGVVSTIFRSPDLRKA